MGTETNQKAIPRRAIVIVLDSCGVGALPDADQYGDVGSNTIANTAKKVGGLFLPNLQRLGLGNICSIQGVPEVDHPEASFGKMAELSVGKDSTNGHWEMMGVAVDFAMPLFPNGFPADLMAEFEARIGRKTLGNKPASGTEIIEELGEEHLRTRYPIIYTSGDSVFQIAAHDSIYPIEELYHICEIARQMLQGEYAVGRVIARPFIGEPGAFKRTEKRKDFSLKPPAPTVLEYAQQAGLEVLGVGKIDYLFANQGITRCTHVKNNDEGISQIIAAMGALKSGILFANLGDFDTLYGHRNNPQGFAGALQAFDLRLPEILAVARPDDALFISADHGCDPTMPSTDHSREYVPVLARRLDEQEGVDLKIRSTFGDLGATIAHLLNLPKPQVGESFALC